MADTTISQLNTINALSANNFIPISDGTNTTKLGTESLFGFRNRIINGDMRIDQRNNGLLITPSEGAAYPADRFKLQISTPSSLTFQRVNDGPAGFKNSIKLTATASTTNNTFINVIQAIEGNNIYDLGWGTSDAKPVTVSFWVKASLTGTYSIALYNNTSTPTRAYATFFNVNQSNIWEKKIITLPGDTQGTWNDNETAGIVLGWTLFNLTSPTYNEWFNIIVGPNGVWRSGNANFKGTVGATFQITGVQLEEGNTATPFENRPYGLELSLCQRYFQKSYQQNVNPGTAGAFLNAISHVYGSGSYQNIWWRLPVTMRTIPIPTAYNPHTGTVGQIWNSSNSTSYSIVFNNQYPYTSDSLVVGRTSIQQTVQNELNVHFTAEAEL